ncbi:NAD-dependent epimerase/dehydratase family protein [Spirulina major]|uniref:NAD-dependent epimerase/dehydratase family protein n=1 Tax=Spirulina major TaxID=270636 RepID=UPI0009345362|nr:GDP-mannose 4,6-dehydratase [Spirulina major]
MIHRFLVIGSNSFSGSHFCRYLIQKQQSVLGISRSSEPNDVFLPYRGLGRDEQFSFQQIDLNHQLPELMEYLHDFDPEYVVNFAAQGMVAQSWQTPEHWYQTNVVAQVKLHDQLRHLSSLKKYVHITTPEAYGSTEGWIKENLHFAPSTPYAVSRAACDLHLMSFFKAYQFPVVFTRAANVYGPGQQLYRIIPRAMLYARLGKVLALHGGGHSIRSFIHIEDVADATYRTALEGVLGQTYHISTWETVSIRELVQKICDLTGVAFEELTAVTEERLGKDQAYLLDSEKIRTELGWQDRVSLDDGLVATLAWIDENLATLKSLPMEYIHKP